MGRQRIAIGNLNQMPRQTAFNLTTGPFPRQMYSTVHGYKPRLFVTSNGRPDYHCNAHSIVLDDGVRMIGVVGSARHTALVWCSDEGILAARHKALGRCSDRG